MHNSFSNWFSAVCFAVLLACIPSLDAAPANDSDRPNVIFIIVDDQDRNQFGFLSPDTAMTPNIDRLANEGTYFPNGFATSTVCTPSRYTCLTGRYPSQASSMNAARNQTPEGLRVVGFNTYVEVDRPNIPNVLQKAGYKTGLVGKWHVGGNGYREEVPPRGSDPADPEVAAMLLRNQENLVKALKGFGFDYAANLYAGNAMDSRALKNTGMIEHNMEWITKGALDFIDRYHAEPFYLFFSTTLPHSPDPVKSLKSDPRISAAGLLTESIDVQPSRDSVLKRVKDAGLPMSAAESLWVDDGIGAILDRLDHYGISENTLILFFNDHGMEFGSKSTLYDGAVRTPIMAYWPGTIKAQVAEAVVSSVDFAPTIFQATDVTPPANMDLRGVSFLDVAEGTAKRTSREFAYSELGYTRALTGADWKYLSFRLPDSAAMSTEESMKIQKKYLNDVKSKHAWVKWEPDPGAKIPHTGGPPGGDFLTRLTFQEKGPFLHNYYDPDQLYHLSEDPLESNNLASNPEYTRQLTRMQDELSNALNTLPGTFADLKPKE
ncbi:MAG: sulfatase-like hydrolase/transferase [Verrucomicrobiota bacterium]